MIISIYPTIGKTAVSKNNLKIVDLDSLPFRTIRDSCKEWWVVYCNIALYLEQQGYIVLVSCSTSIFKYLKEHAQSYYIVMYDSTLKDYCFSKALKRYKEDPKNNSTKTLNWILNKFDEVLDRIIKDSNKYNINLTLIKDKDYSLEEIIKSLALLNLD